MLIEFTKYFRLTFLQHSYAINSLCFHEILSSQIREQNKFYVKSNLVNLKPQKLQFHFIV